MSKNPLCLAILWHMHQPDYGNVQTGEIYLPWTRFHALKDYYDMAALAEESQGVHLTINLVPSLLDQLLSYGSGGARETYAALTLKNAADLEHFEKTFLLRSFFQLPWKEMVLPYPRYRELLERRGAPDERGEYETAARQMSTQDLRDLQVWFNLAWCGRELRREPEIAALLRKGRRFTEEEKSRLLQAQYAFIGRIIPYYRALADQGWLELSTSPYYHPILPLLCDNRSARESLPGIALPEHAFSFPSDAREQIVRAQKRYRECFGREARGMWPSEGAISNAALALARDAGVRWLASDEAVLQNSLQKQGLALAGLSLQQRYRAHLWGRDAGGPCLFFRDHELSDLIGFTYSRWGAAEAAADFMGRLRAIHNSLPDDGRHYVVPVVLDGENAWEHYPENGTRFLSLLYGHLRAARDVRTVTFSEYLELEPTREVLGSVVAGSWIYGNLATWIGHPEKNRGWTALTAARSFLGPLLRDGNAPGRQEAFSELLTAEGSDWFWWYGDDHQTENAAEFDELFRSHVKNVYRLAGQPYPPDLDAPIKKAELRTRMRDPVHTITPRLDGKVSDYFEWLAAGYAAPGGGESMHRTLRHFEHVYFGYDARRFYLRIDPAAAPQEAPGTAPAFEVRFAAPREFLLRMENREGSSWHCRTIRSANAELATEFAAERIIELGIPLEALGVEKPDQVSFCISALAGERELERFPPHGFITVTVDPWGLDDREWIV